MPGLDAPYPTGRTQDLARRTDVWANTLGKARWGRGSSERHHTAAVELIEHSRGLLQVLGEEVAVRVHRLDNGLVPEPSLNDLGM